MWAYWDTSALVKRYVHERGRRAVMTLLKRYDFVSSTVLPVELRSAFRRRVDDGTLEPDELAKVIERMAADRQYWRLIEVSAEVLAGAEALVATQPLRTLDGIHVASAQFFAARLPTAPLFVSADKRQTDVAVAIGLSVRRIV